MIARLIFTTFAAFFLFQLMVDAIVIRRDVGAAAAAEEKPKDAAQTIDEALQSFKTGLDDLFAKIQNNELVQNATANLKQLGESIQQQSKALVEKIQQSTATTKN